MAKTLEKALHAEYQSELEKVGALDAPPWWKALRQAGADRFQITDFPHSKEEAWRFTNIAPVVKTRFRPVIASPDRAAAPEDAAPDLFDEPGWPQLVFVDGLFSKALSRGLAEVSGLHVGSLPEAAESQGAIVQKYLGQCVEPLNAFITLNTGFLQDGAFVYVEKNTELDAPIHLLFLSTGAEGVATHPRNLLVAGPSSRCTVIETYAGLSNGTHYLTNGVTEVVIGENARVDRLKVVREGSEAFHLATDNIRIGRDARFHSHVITLEGKIVRNELRVLLDGEGGEARLNGLYLNDGDRLIDNALNVEHGRSKCYSRMAYKGVLDGASRSVFTGKVLVPRGSQQTDSDQLNNNLILSESASIDTKPQLEIFADDVRCTHGATVGSFPDQLIFYFQSRGIDPAKAHGILTYGFAAEIVEGISVGPLRDRLDTFIFDRYNPGS